MVILTLVAFVLMSWLLLAARSTEQFQYYIWSFFVPILWSQAAYGRDPKKYSSPVRRIVTALFVWSVVLMFILGVFYVIENPEFIQTILESVEETPTPTVEPESSLLPGIGIAISMFFP